jgi:hypothetical protein
MLERVNPVLRIICFALAALVLFQMTRLLLPRGRALADFSANTMKTVSGTNSISTTNTAVAKVDALPPEITARIEKIKESQVLGQIMRPPPMAVIGLAGNEVLLRTDSGQTGWVTEGGELGGVKIVKIGTNRVLVEQQGQTKELMLFQGFGSQSLLEKESSK